jgi:hypothetical protein
MYNDILNTVNPRYNGLRCNGQNIPLCKCVFLEMLRHQESFLVTKLFTRKIKKNINIKKLYVITLCVSVFIACIGYVSYGVLA